MPFIISLRQRFLFIHVPKTGGLSLYQVLRPFDDRSTLVDTPQMGKVFALRSAMPLTLASLRTLGALEEHASAAQLRQVLGERTFDALPSFAVVRNPWAIEVSNYHYILASPDHPSHAMVASRGSFAAYVDTLAPGPRQAPFVCDEEGRLLVNRLLSFDHLQTDFMRLCADLGLPADPLPHINRSGHRPWTDFYTRDLFQRVAERRAQDIVLTGAIADPDAYGIRD